jgi:hypothetical protein
MVRVTWDLVRGWSITAEVTLEVAPAAIHESLLDPTEQGPLDEDLASIYSAHRETLDEADGDVIPLVASHEPVDTLFRPVGGFRLVPFQLDSPKAPTAA